MNEEDGVSMETLLTGDIKERVRMDLAWFRAQAELLPEPRRGRALEALHNVAAMFGLESDMEQGICNRCGEDRDLNDDICRNCWREIEEGD